MTNTQPQRRSLTVKAILGLLLAVVAVGAFAVASSAGSTGVSARGGALHVTKECSDYHGLAGQHCTIKSSNIPQIKVGSKVVYASAAGDPTPGQLNSDLVIDGPGNNTAYGHVVLDLSTGTGVVTFSGGTGEFKHFRARVAVSPIDPPPYYFAWDGTYSFNPQN
jgi:hypothetical protein